MRAASVRLRRGAPAVRAAEVLGCMMVGWFVSAGCAESVGVAERSARVTRVIDGDTVEMERLGKVRLIGVDTPEQGRCYENAATRFTRDRLDGQVVRYEIGAERRDRYERTLVYVTRDREMHNLALLHRGYAKVLTIPPNDKYEPAFEAAEREARSGRAGLWSSCDSERRGVKRGAGRDAIARLSVNVTRP
jgi:endonuclease YncB( thermonuclease family)